MTDLVWHKVADPDTLAEGRVTTVTAGTTSLALVHFAGQYTAMDNRCPHQRGPLGEGSLEQGVDGQCWLRCPWHGWDFDPLTGRPPGGHHDTGQTLFPVETRSDGLYVGIPAETPHQATVSDVMAQTMVNWGIRSVFGMVGHSNLGLADALRLQEVAGNLRFYGIRHEGAASFACSGYAKLSGKPAACLSIAGPGATNLLTGLWDAKVDRAPGAGADRSGGCAGVGTRQLSGDRPRLGVSGGGPVQSDGSIDLETCRADDIGVPFGGRDAGCVASDLSG